MPKIWIDITTPKQVMFFRPLIKKLREKNYNLFVTSRDYYELNEMLANYEVEVHFFGKHGGKTLEGKLKASLERALDLTNAIASERPDLLVSLTSDVAARVAFGLQIPHISTSDSPFAIAVNKLSIPYVTKLVVPRAIEIHEWTRFGIAAADIVSYDAVDAVAWLENYIPDPNVLEELKLTKQDLIVLLRPEEAYAAYTLNWKIKEPIIYPTIRAILEAFPTAKLVTLPRYEEQYNLFKKDFSKKLIIPEKPIDVPSLLSYSSLMVGFAGTINQEAAILGIPTVSFRPIPLWCDYYLQKRGLLYITKSPEEAAKLAVEILSKKNSYLIKHKNLANKALQEMENPIEKLLNLIYEYFD